MKILHLYYDFMNLYGEYANISALERLLQKSGIDFQTDRLSLQDDVSFSDYDFIYIGSGTERNRNIAMEHLRLYKSALAECIDRNTVLLMTGNAFEMFGKSITSADGRTAEGLGLFNFTVTEQKKSRNTADAIFTADFLDKPLVGFINKCSEISGIDAPLFTVRMGLGNQQKDKNEGIRLNNFFGTHLTGPVMMKNPHFLLYVAQLIAKDAVLSTDHLGYENAAYEITLSELTKLTEKNN